MSAVLETQDVECVFGGVTALSDVSISIGEGRTVGLIGPNGAGKSTLLNCITGYYRPSRGSVSIRGEVVHRGSPRRMNTLGVTRTFQNLALFEAQDVLDNVMFGAYGRTGDRAESAVRSEARDVLADLELTEVASRKVSDLPYPMRKRVEFGRCLMSGASVVLLDEPTSGMGVQDAQEFAGMLERAREQRGLSLGVVAHDMAFVFRICDEVYVLDAGTIIYHGPPEGVKSDPDVRRVYLGSRG